MAYSVQQFTSTGVEDHVVLSFPYLDKSDIHLYGNSVEVAFTWASDNRINFTPFPAGVEVVVRRLTDRARVRYLLQEGAPFTREILDQIHTQSLYLAQEAAEGVFFDMYGDINMHGFRVRNAGDPEFALDYTTKQWVQGEIQAVNADYRLRADLAATGGAGLITDSLKPATWVGFAGGADKTGVRDSTAALDAVYTGANSDGWSIIIPAGTYKVGSVLRNIQSDTLWLSRDFNSGVSATDSAIKTPLLITVGNPDQPELSSLYTRVGANITAIGRGGQHIDCIRASLINYSTDGQGNTAIYASASSTPTALWSAALHGETKHNGGTSIAISSESASYTPGGTFYGAVLNNTTGTAAETHPTTGAPVVAHPTATALYITGGTSRGEMGQWVRGIRFSPLSMRANGTLVRDESSCGQGYWSLPSSVKAVADILLEGTAPQGIVIQGTYASGNGIRLASGTAIAYEATGAIKTRYSSADVQWGLYNGSTQRVGFGTAVYGMYFNGLKVVGERQAAVPTATSDNYVSVINSIRQVLQNHGLTF